MGINGGVEWLDLLSADNSPLSDAEPNYLLPGYIRIYLAVLNVVYVR